MIGDPLPPPPVIAVGESLLSDHDPRAKDVLDWSLDFFKPFGLELTEIKLSETIDGTIILRGVIHEDGQPNQKYTCWRRVDGAIQHRITV